MKEIKLQKGHRTKVDDDLYDDLKKYSWFVKPGKNLYVVRSVYKNGSRGTIYLHRQIMAAKKGQVVDHINCDSLDNRRENLRFCTVSENGHNVKSLNSNNKSGFRGVSFSKKRGRWMAQIVIDRRHKWLGYFNSAHQASLAYNAAKVSILVENHY